MKDIVRILNGILLYYASTRQVGHTNAMLRGAENTKCKIVSADYQQARQFGKDGISLHKFMYGGMLGRADPIVWDNYAIVALVHQAKKRIEELEMDLIKGTECRQQKNS